jgi:putative oxidoreductase
MELLFSHFYLMILITIVERPFWKSYGAFIGRILFAAVFAMAATFKFMGMSDTAAFIASAGFPAPLFLAWVAAFFEVGLVFTFLTGAWFREGALLAIIYVLFLGFVFHGPAHWAGSQSEFGFFVDHFTFAAGLLFALAFGPGSVLVWNHRKLHI